MLVELVGPPGSGKSTIAPVLAEALDARLVDLRGRRNVAGGSDGTLRRWVFWLVAIAERRGVTVRVLWRLGHRRYVLRLMLEAMHHRSQLAELDGLVIIDDGPAHRLLVALAASGWNRAVTPFLPLLQDVGLLALVDTDPGVAIGRALTDGGRPSVSDLGHDRAVEAARRYRALAFEMAEASGMPLVVSDEVQFFTAEILRVRRGEPTS